MTSQTHVLKILHDSVISKVVRHGYNFSPVDLHGFVMKLLQCLSSKEYILNAQLGPLAYVVCDSITGNGPDMLDPIEVSRFMTSGAVKTNNVLQIDFEGRYISTSEYTRSYFSNTEEACDASREEHTLLFIFIKGNELTIFGKGTTIRNIPDILSTNPVGQIKTWLPISEYFTLLQRHYDEEIVGERGMLYWSNRKERILFARPEERFRKQLARFLSDNVADGFVDEESRNANTTNKTDIRVITFDQKIYIFEIKWLGKSEGKEYCNQAAIDRANEGIIQLTEYLIHERRSIRGVLIIYDARGDNDRSITWLDKAQWDKRIDTEPKILFLDSENASTKAKKAVQQLKKTKE